MRVLVACEFSGIVRDAFRARGHDTVSCDLLPCERPNQDGAWHVQGDVLAWLETWSHTIDLLIAHPPCTYLTVAGNKWFGAKYHDRFPHRRRQQKEAVAFFMALATAPIYRVAVENPIGVMSTRWRKPDQIVQPWWFGHQDRKPTCLWLKNLPILQPTNIVEPRIKRNRNGKTASVHHDAALSLPAEERWKVRSRTYQGIAEAMAAQWG